MRETVNSFGIPIYMCCASCSNKEADNVHRFCTKGEGIVKKEYYCEKWCMAKGLESAGKIGGGIKKKEYLMYVMNEVIKDEQKAADAKLNKEIFVRRTTKDIRDSWIEKHGSIYAISL